MTDDFDALCLALVEQQLAALDAADAAAAAVRTSNRSSVVFTLRLGLDEQDALRRRAAAVGIPPSVLARNLIRTGLTPRMDEDVFAGTLDRIDEAVAA